MVTKPHAFFVNYFPTYTTILHKTCLPPIIHNISSINIYRSIQNSIKTKHLPQFKPFLRQTHIQHNMWDKYEKYMAAWIYHISTARIQAPEVTILLTKHRPTTLEDCTCPTKCFCPNNAHSLNNSHRKFFITLTCGIQVLYIETNSNQYCCDSHNTILFCVCPWHIKSNTLPLTITCIMTS